MSESGKIESGKIESFQELEHLLRLAVEGGAERVGIDLENGHIVGLRCDWRDDWRSYFIPVELES